MKASVTRRFSFEAAHRLKAYDEECSNLHGHSYKVEVTFSQETDTPFFDKVLPMVIDFKDLDILGEMIISPLDHSDLNEKLGMDNPTAEFIAYWVALQFDANLKQKKIVGEISVKVQETENSWAVVSL